MKLAVTNSIGGPELIAKDERNISTLFSLVIPKELRVDLARECLRDVFHNGTKEQRLELASIVMEWNDAMRPIQEDWHEGS